MAAMLATSRVGVLEIDERLPPDRGTAAALLTAAGQERRNGRSGSGTDESAE